MWSIELLETLVIKVKDVTKKEVQEFLTKLFAAIKEEIYQSDPAIPEGVFLGVIEKSYELLKDREDNSVRLLTFQEMIFTLSLIFAKVECELTIDSSYFIPVYNKFFNSGNALAAMQKAEMDMLIKLNDSVEPSIQAIEKIFWHYGTKEARDSFTQDCDSLPIGESTAFDDLLGNMVASKTLQDLKSFIIKALPFVSKNEANVEPVEKSEVNTELEGKDEAVKLIERLEAEWVNVEAKLKNQQIIDRDSIDQTTSAFRVSACEQIDKSLLVDYSLFSLNDAQEFNATFGSSRFLRSPQAENLKNLLEHPTAVAIKTLIDFANNHQEAPDLSLFCAKYQQDMQSWSIKSTIENDAYQQKLFNEVDDFFFRKTSWTMLTLFNETLTRLKVPSLFTPLIDKFATMDDSSVMFVLNSIYNVSRLMSFSSQYCQPLGQLIITLRMEWREKESKFGEKTAAEVLENISNFKQEIALRVEQFLSDNSNSIELDRLCYEKFANLPYFSAIIQKLSIRISEFNNHPISNDLKKLETLALSETGFKADMLNKLHIAIKIYCFELYDELRKPNSDVVKITNIKKQMQDLVSGMPHLGSETNKGINQALAGCLKIENNTKPSFFAPPNNKPASTGNEMDSSKAGPGMGG